MRPVCSSTAACWGFLIIELTDLQADPEVTRAKQLKLKASKGRKKPASKRKLLEKASKEAKKRRKNGKAGSTPDEDAGEDHEWQAGWDDEWEEWEAWQKQKIEEQECRAWENEKWEAWWGKDEADTVKKARKKSTTHNGKPKSKAADKPKAAAKAPAKAAAKDETKPKAKKAKAADDCPEDPSRPARRIRSKSSQTLQAEDEKKKSPKKAKLAKKKSDEPSRFFAASALEAMVNFAAQFQNNRFHSRMKASLREQLGNQLHHCTLNVYWTRCACGVHCRTIEKDISYFFLQGDASTFLIRLCLAMKAAHLFALCLHCWGLFRYITCHCSCKLSMLGSSG